MNTGKLVLNIILGLAVIALTFYLYKIIQDPIQFEKSKTKRYDKAIERLEVVKRAQFAYKDKTGKFAQNWNALITTLKNDSIAEVKITGNPDDLEADSTLVVTYDTTMISLKDKYFSDGYPLDSIQYIPYSGGKTFNINAGEIEVGAARIKVPVFEVSVDEETLLSGLSEDYMDRSKTLQLGSMSEATYNGNW